MSAPTMALPLLYKITLVFCGGQRALVNDPTN